jgi:Domain of unknown function DUF11/PASTA domain
MVCGVFAVTGAPASALTLGTTTIPSGASPNACTTGAFYAQSTTDGAIQYAVPSAGGEITSWSTNTTGATAGTPLTLLVLRPSGGAYKIVGFNSETLPSPLPASGIATFTVASPISAVGGDVLGLYGSATSVTCFFSGGPSIPAADIISAAAAVAPPAVGSTYTPAVSAPNILTNVAATLVQSEDVSMTGSAMPSSITAGGAAEYSFNVSHAGPTTVPITFTDTVPSGLTILSAVAGSGTCTVTGQAVSCTINADSSGASSSVSIVVTAPSAGRFTDTASVSTSLADPSTANNSASATLTVNRPARTPCKTIALAGAPLSVARTVIPALNCKVGKITKKASRNVHKGNVISTSPGPGKTLTAGSKVNVVVSAGPPKRKRKRK